MTGTLEEATLREWMAAHVPDFNGPVHIEQFPGGQSNPTFRVSTPVKSYVLRRQPAGTLLKGAHAVDREARVMSALSGSEVPVPRIHALCEDPGVIGSMFYVMDLVPGRNFLDSAFPELPIGERASYLDAMNAALASLHRVEAARVGLADFGRPQGYVLRQIDRWSRQYIEDPAAGRSPYMDELLEWLPVHAPGRQDASIIHGDFRVDNLIFHPSRPQVVAILDWELSTLGDPLADFTYHLMMYRLPPGISGGIQGRAFSAEGLLDEAEYVRRYCRRTSRDGIPDLTFYLAFNMFRFAAILHGIRGRILRGTAASAHAGEMASKFEFLAEAACRLARRGS